MLRVAVRTLWMRILPVPVHDLQILPGAAQAQGRGSSVETLVCLPVLVLTLAPRPGAEDAASVASAAYDASAVCDVIAQSPPEEGMRGAL